MEPERPQETWPRLSREQLIKYLDYGLTPDQRGGMHILENTVSPYWWLSFIRKPEKAPGGCLNPRLERFLALYHPDPPQLDERRFGSQGDPRLEKRLSGKDAGLRTIHFREPSFEQRSKDMPGIYERLHDVAFFDALIMKRTSVEMTDTSSQALNTAIEIYREIILGYFLNALTLRRVSIGFTVLVDWFRGTWIEAKSERIDVLEAACQRHYRRQQQRRQARKPDASPRPVRYDQQYLIYERLRHPLNVHISSMALGSTWKPADPGRALRVLRAALFQICHALAMGWRARRFVHYDLHAENVLFSTSRHYILEKARRPELEDKRGLLFVIGDRDAARPRHFHVPYADTDDRLVKLIDFGRSRMRLMQQQSTRGRDPDDTRHFLGIDMPEHGIKASREQPRYDLRRLAFDLVANTASHTDVWQPMLESDPATGRALRDFFIRALDADTICDVVRTSWVAAVQQPLMAIGRLGEYWAPQQRWLALVHERSGPARNDHVLDALFALSTGKRGGRVYTRAEDEVLAGQIKPGRHLDHYLYHLIWNAAILRFDDEGGERASAVARVRRQRRWEEDDQLTLPRYVPAGLTAEAAVHESALFAPYRLRNAAEAEALVAREQAMRVNQTCAEAGIPPFAL